jgi:hypothetical protein
MLRGFQGADFGKCAVWAKRTQHVLASKTTLLRAAKIQDMPPDNSVSLNAFLSFSFGSVPFPFNRKKRIVGWGRMSSVLWVTQNRSTKTC